MRKLTTLTIAALALVFSGVANAADMVRIGTEGAYPPFNEKNEKGELVGFDVDIAKALCAKIGAECTYVAQDWDGIIPGLKAKKYDAIVASMSITDERMKQVDFTNPYYANYLQFIAKKGGGLTTTPAGLKGKTVGAQRSTVSSQYLEDNFKDVKIKLYDTQTAAYGDLKAGRLDAMLSDIYPALQWLADPANNSFEATGARIDIDDKIGIAVRKEDTALKAKLNKALGDIIKDGTYEKISTKYFGKNIY